MDFKKLLREEEKGKGETGKKKGEESKTASLALFVPHLSVG